MPYIADKLRKKPIGIDGYTLETLVTEFSNCLSTEFTDTQIDGVLNYVITRLINETRATDTLWHQPRYNKIERAIGLIECVKLELYRLIAAQYEDQKRAENGDVF